MSNGTGRFHTEWHSERHNVHVKRELHTTMECRPRQYAAVSHHPNSSNEALTDDLSTFLKVHNLLLSPSTPLKHIPLRIYIPSTPPTSHSPSDYGSYKIVQTLIPPQTLNREIQTLGSALNTLLPSLFPSRRDAILAEPVLHGAAVPFRAPLQELMRVAAYADGWLHLSVVMVDA